MRREEIPGAGYLKMEAELLLDNKFRNSVEKWENQRVHTDDLIERPQFQAPVKQTEIIQ